MQAPVPRVLEMLVPFRAANAPYQALVYRQLVALRAATEIAREPPAKCQFLALVLDLDNGRCGGGCKRRRLEAWDLRYDKDWCYCYLGLSLGDILVSNENNVIVYFAQDYPSKPHN